MPQRSNHPTPESEATSNELRPAPSPQRVWLVPCVLLPLLLFGLLAEDVTSRETIRFDDPVLLRLHAHADPLWNSVMLFFTRVGGLPILGYTVLLVAVLLWKKQRARAAFLLSAMAGTCLLNVALKAAFQRTRPDLWLSIAPERDFSFPSGHSMLSCTFTLAVLALVWHSRAAFGTKWIATILGVSFMVGVVSSRLYLGVHYPSDVLAGFCLSLSLVSLLWGIFGPRFRRTPVLAAR